jgi:DNA-binding NarL/FixJ family response regulator
VIVLGDDRAIGQELPGLVTRMRRGEFAIETSLDLADVPEEPPVVSTPNLLSGREQQVLGMLARGLRNKEIAEQLFIAPSTVNYHLTAIFNKLGVANRTEAVSVALRRGILTLDLPAPSASDAA